MRIIKIGRDPGCNIVLNSPKVSSLHAEITLMDSGDMLLEDKGSHNGTFVMNQPIKPGKQVNIRRGDAIRFADVELSWAQVPQPEDNSAYRAIYSIGSDFKNSIQLSGATVSRYHATVKQGKDGKFYIFDHSKNGTTVDGQKIAPNTPVRIKKNSAVVCGGVPADLSRSIPWPNDAWKTIAGIAAAVIVLAAVGIGLWKSGIIKPGPREMDESELYARYSSSVVLLQGLYHFEISCDGVDLSELKNFPLPEKLLFYTDSKGPHFMPYDMITDEAKVKYGSYFGTGFFVSKDGKIITNLHVVKPWLFETAKEMKNALEKYAREEFLRATYGTTDQAFVDRVRVKGVSDGIVFIPQGKYYSSENMISCRTLSAGSNPEKDVALLQSLRSELPTGATCVNIKDSIDVNADNLKNGTYVYTLGFPAPALTQDFKSTNGMQAVDHDGKVTQKPMQYSFQHSAATIGGASGSPIFNKEGKLVGVLNAGITGTQGFNFGILSKYVQEIVDSPYVVEEDK